MSSASLPPDWAFEFHGHRCPFMPIGWRIGELALDTLGIERERDHGFYVFPELGEGHPQTCLMDGIQAATGATYGKVMMAKTFYGKLAAVFYHPEHEALRIALTADFLDAMGSFEFFSYRKRGVEPSQIPAAVTDEVIDWMLARSDEEMLKIKRLPEFTFTPIKGSFNKTKCAACGEYVFDRYLRLKNGQPMCIPCSGYGS